MANEETDDYQPDPAKEEAWERLGKAIEESKGNNRNGNRKAKEKEKKKPRFDAFKYSRNGRGPLFEAIVLSGSPVFITYQNGKIEPYGEIEEEVRLIEPPHAQSYPYTPYEFRNMDEILDYRDRALAENIDSLYQKAKCVAEIYNDQRKEKINLLATEIISSYFQDLFPTIHYTIVLGGNGSGKSSYGDTFTETAYRVVNLTNPNAANINRILGCIEVGQCTIVSDETGPIDKNTDLMAILKTGYAPNCRTSKVNDYSRAPEFFYTYCFKIIISERMPNLRDAKGVVDRSFSFTTYKGRPLYDIKETLIHQRNPARLTRLAELHDFRKLMLIYRLIHFQDAITDIDIGLEGREKELTKPIIQLFYNSQAQSEVEATLQYFLKLKSEKKEITLEPVLYPIVVNLVAQSKRPDKEISVAEIWEQIRADIEGYYDEKKPHEYQTLDYGTIYNNTISNILEHTFGGRPKHRTFGNTFIFDLEELTRVGKAYNLKTDIQTKIIEIEQSNITKDEGMKAPSPLGKPPIPKEDENQAQNEGNRGQNQSWVPSIEPSQPSCLHTRFPENTTEDSSIVQHNLYWSGSNWACHNCKLRGDKFTMQNIPCNGNKK
jgi:hypothetical protein